MATKSNRELKLTLFVEAYFSSGGNAVEAALASGCRGKRASLAVTGCRMLRAAKESGLFQKALQKHMQTFDAAHVVELLKAQALGLEPTKTIVSPQGRTEYDRLGALQTLARINGQFRDKPDQKPGVSLAVLLGDALIRARKLREEDAARGHVPEVARIVRERAQRALCPPTEL